MKRTFYQYLLLIISALSQANYALVLGKYKILVLGDFDDLRAKDFEETIMIYSND